MILFAVLLFASEVAAQATEEDIIVLARKLDATRYTWDAVPSDDSWTLKSCEVLRSGGDTEIDAIACPAISACLPQLDKPGKRVPRAFQQCLTETRRSMLSALADRRAEAAADEAVADGAVADGAVAEVAP